MLNRKNPTGGRAGIRSLPFLLAVLALLWTAGPVQAHGEQYMSFEMIWPLPAEEQPEELEGVTIQIEHNEAGPWLVAENNTGETLEIYDAKGEPFLRIGPEGVEYNRFAEEYYQTAFKEQVPKEVPENPGAEAEWVYLDDEPRHRWLDQRIATEGMSIAEWVPEEVRQAREDADVGEWSIPVRLGEAETEVRGTYRYDGPPKGAYLAMLNSQPENPDITIGLIHGTTESADALSLQNRSGEPVTIFDASGEPAIQIGPEEVQINTNSPVGRAADRRSSDLNASTLGGEEEPLETAQPEWEKVSAGSAFTWLDPRLRPPNGQAEPPPGDPETAQEDLARWAIPMEVAGEQVRLAGRIDWQPSPPLPALDEESKISVQEVATVGAVTVVPALVIMALLLGPGLYKRYRYRR